MTRRKKVQNKLPLIALPFHCCRLNIYLGTRVATLPVCTMKMRALWKADDPWIRFMFCSKGCKITFGCVATFGNFAFLISFHILQLMAFQDWVNAIRSREIIVSFETHDYSLLMTYDLCWWWYDSGSSGRVKGEGGKKHEIYAGAFGGHLFYDLFSQGRGRVWPPRPPGSATVVSVNNNQHFIV